MKLGGSIVAPYQNAEQWGRLLEESHFAAIPFPVTHKASKQDVRDILAEMARQDVVVAEVGIWNSPIFGTPEQQQSAMAYAINQLAFADAIGAKCCVNVVGALSGKWDGPSPDNYSPKTYEAIITSLQIILDTVKPTKTYLTIEPMPWMLPDGPDEYLKMIQDVNRDHFAVHMDFVNMISNPRRYLFAAAFIEECFQKLSPFVKSCHIKDILLDDQYFTSLLKETQPGQGKLDFAKVLQIIHRYTPLDMPVLLEHMNTQDEYAKSYNHLASIAKQGNIPIR